ncbi:hypothetical protein HY468_04795 [Candidatus Roizmanbacteria bacterium]|nr:hypothetical protein [Candidatus Roizmanbacteria bacterium]
MNRKPPTLTIKNIEELFDKKLEPIKDDLTTIKQVVEQRVYKEMKKGFAHVNKRIDRLEEISLAIIYDSNDHESRIKKLEKRAGLPSNNN